MSNKQKRNDVANCLIASYGVDPLQSPTVDIIWATLHVAKKIDIDIAKQNLKEINTMRKKAGKMPAYVPFGSICF